MFLNKYIYMILFILIFFDNLQSNDTKIKFYTKFDQNNCTAKLYNSELFLKDLKIECSYKEKEKGIISYFDKIVDKKVLFPIFDNIYKKEYIYDFVDCNESKVSLKKPINYTEINKCKIYLGNKILKENIKWEEFNLKDYNEGFLNEHLKLQENISFKFNLLDPLTKKEIIIKGKTSKGQTILNDINKATKKFFKLSKSEKILVIYLGEIERMGLKNEDFIELDFYFKFNHQIIGVLKDPFNKDIIILFNNLKDLDKSLKLSNILTPKKLQMANKEMEKELIILRKDILNNNNNNKYISNTNNIFINQKKANSSSKNIMKNSQLFLKELIYKYKEIYKYFNYQLNFDTKNIKIKTLEY